MSFEGLIPLRVSDIQGVSNQLIDEELPEQYCSILQNLYERKMGELVRKGGTLEIATTFPEGGSPAASMISGINNAMILKKRDASKIHIQAVSVDRTRLTSNPINLANLATAAFVNSGGNWGTVLPNPPNPANTYLDTNGTITLQYHGYGINFSKDLTVTRGASDNTLSITVPALIDPRILGINVYSNVDVWNNLFGFESSIWIGYIDLNLPGTRGVTYDFSQAPITQKGVNAVSGVMYGSATKPTFTLSGTTGGTLISGKTYYVSVLEQYFGGSNLTTLFRARETAGSVSTITLAQGQTGITITPVSGILGDSACYCIAIGEDPQILQPVFITNNTISTILGIPTASPNVVGMTPYSLTQTDYVWRFCDATTADMFFKYSSLTTSGTLPIYVGRTTETNHVVYGSADNISAISGGTVWYFYEFRSSIAAMPDGANYCYAQIGQLGFVVNDSVIIGSPSRGRTGGASSSLYNTTYLVTDGRIVAQVVFDYGTSVLPKPKYLTTFQESIIAGGGVVGSEAYDKIFCSNAYNPYNFSDSGAGTNLAFIGLEAAGEPVTGIGIFSITTANEGVGTQLLIGARTNLFKLSAIPSAADFGTAFLEQLSNKIGLANHFTIVNTELGTIICGLDDVYLLRESGEPIPIGQDIADYIKSDDVTLGQTSSFWSAVYHDGHYKLAYSKPGSTTVDQELWLNLRRMKANKGKPSWYGPHTGRAFQFSVVDTPLAAGETEKRILIDTVLDKNHYADSPTYTTDLDLPIQTILGTKGFVGEGGEFRNKKLVHFQIRGRATGQFNMVSSWIVDGALAETAIIQIKPKMNGTDILQQPTQVFPFFPVSRIRGRTLQLRLESETLESFGLSGFFIGIRPEGRRI